MLWLLLLLAAVYWGDGCNLIAKGNHGKTKVQGYGLHRTLQITTFIQAKQRVPQCRVLYKIVIPKGIYIDERELHSSTPGYDFLILPDKVKAYDVLYAVRQKLYLSTFEMKETLDVKFHLHPPSHAYPTSIKLEEPYIAMDCKGDTFAECPSLKVPKNRRLKASFGRWIHVEYALFRPPVITAFREEKLYDEYPHAAMCILLFTLSFTLSYLMTT